MWNEVTDGESYLYGTVDGFFFLNVILLVQFIIASVIVWRLI